MIIRYTGEDFDNHWGFTDWRNKIILDIGADYGSTAECFLAYGASEIYALEGNDNLYKELVEYSKYNPIIPIKKLIKNSNDFVYILTNDYYDIVKIDCEGAEIHILDVPENILLYIREYAIECHSNDILNKILKKFENLGYRLMTLRYLTTNISVVHFVM